MEDGDFLAWETVKPVIPLCLNKIAYGDNI